MNKKKLPKAIWITGDEAGESKTVLASDESVSITPSSGEPLDQPDAVADSAEVTPLVRPASHDPPPAPAPTQVVAAGALEPMPQAEANSAHALVRVGVDQESRRWQARAIVERHANYSAVGGVIPLPIVNIAAVTAIILRMVKSLSNLYGVPFQRHRARAIVTGLIGGLTPAALSTMTASSLLFIVPGSNLLGLAVSSVTASTCTRRIGRIFIDHFESGATLAELPLLARP
jgi:uncharacterized protein (DUF697 family)